MEEFYNKGNEVVEPLFKFLPNEWANALVNEGSVQLCYTDEFRKDKYPGKIYDKDEGYFSVRNLYTSYNGLAKDAYGLLGFLPYPQFPIVIRNQEVRHNFNLYYLLVYCTSNFLFSESLNQAFLDEKDSCVMITHPKKFFKIISERVELKDFEFRGYNKCIYESRSLYEADPGEESLTEEILKNQVKIGYFKPQEYANQLEFRAAWVPKKVPLYNPSNLGPVRLKINELRKYCMQIDISKVDKNKVLLNNDTIEVQQNMYLKDGRKPFSLVRTRNEISSLKIYKNPDDGLEYIGFFRPGDTLEGGIVSGADYGYMPVPDGFLYSIVRLGEIERIEYIIR